VHDLRIANDSLPHASIVSQNGENLGRDSRLT
jgi:hypothetical protein